MRKIKFRGLAYAGVDGKKIKPQMVYGSLRINEEMDYASISTFKDKQGATYTYLVDPESIAQFVGYDCNGNEIYEGDKVHGIRGTMDGHSFTARLANVAQSTNGMYWGFQSEEVRKESGGNEN